MREITDAEVEAVATALAPKGWSLDGWKVMPRPEHRARARNLLELAARAEDNDNPGARMYDAQFSCSEEGHKGVRLKFGRPYCLNCDKPWTHIGEIAS